MTFIESYIMPFVDLLNEMAPYLLLGFLIAGLLHAFVPNKVYRRYLGKNDTKSVVLSLLLGIPLPLCSCGVIPTAVGMRKEGASKGATTAFLIATPQTGVDSILATYSVLGLPFAILRPLVALVTGLFGGIAVNKFDKNAQGEAVAKHVQAEEEKKTFAQKCLSALDYGFNEMLMDIGKWLVIGLILAGLITIFVPDNFFVDYQGNYILNMFIVLLIACPMYVCATGSIPVAAALMLKGLSPGAALVFLMAGPATNMASMMVLGKTLGKRTLIIYLTSILIGAIGFGLLVDMCIQNEWLSMVSINFHLDCCHESASWWEIASSVLLVALLLRGLWLRLHGKGHDHHHEHVEGQASGTVFVVKGMTCSHCRGRVKDAIEGVKGVTKVEIDQASSSVFVEGDIDAEAVISAVTGNGYECRLA